MRGVTLSYPESINEVPRTNTKSQCQIPGLVPVEYESNNGLVLEEIENTLIIIFVTIQVLGRITAGVFYSDARIYSMAT